MAFARPARTLHGRAVPSSRATAYRPLAEALVAALGEFALRRTEPPPDMVGYPLSLPDGWQPVELNNCDLARLTGTTQRGCSNAVIVRKDYGVRFRDGEGEFHAYDDLDAEGGRIFRIVGISLRSYRRIARRYRR